MRPALQEGSEVLLAPGVVDDQKNAPVAERLAELRRSRVYCVEPRPLASQEHDEIGEGGDEPLRLLAKLGPENAVEIGVLNVGVVGERLGERRLAVAARAPERRGNRCDGVAPGVEELVFSASNSLGRETKSSGGSGAIIGTRFCRLSA